MTVKVRSNHGRPRREFTPEEDAIILAWCKGEIGLFDCIRRVNSSVPTVKNRASILCGEHLGFSVPKHTPNKNYRYFGQDGEPLDVSNYSLTVGKDKYLQRLQRGLR